MLATVLDVVDSGYRGIVARDAVCRSSDEGSDLLMRLYPGRHTEQTETARRRGSPRASSKIL